MEKVKATLSGWGNFPASDALICRPENIFQLELNGLSSALARGLGRSYGDAALNKNGQVFFMQRLNRLLAFDSKSGLLKAESGVTYADLLATFVPRGWFPPVTPGTKAVTLGGAIAADLHGKNHHADGSLGRHLQEIIVLTANGGRQACSRQKNRDLFVATLGGMGLTGAILEATLQLQPIETAWMHVETAATENIDQTIEMLYRPRHEMRYSVAWCDLLAKGSHFGRSIVMEGRHAAALELSSSASKSPLQLPALGTFKLPCNAPSWLLNQWNMRLFNRLYYHHYKNRTAPALIDYEHFFYPLDSLGHWNRLYGKRGFIQYQCVLPLQSARTGLRSLLEKLQRSGLGVFMAVLKQFGPAGDGLLSFPMEGISLAIDLPHRGEKLFPLLDQFDALVIAHGGRTYLAKDARMQAESFRAMYPQLEAWQRIKNHVDPRNLWNSDLAKRLGIGGY